MSRCLRFRRGVAALAVALLVAAPGSRGEPFDVPLANPALSGVLNKNGAPPGWSTYGGGGPGQALDIVEGPGGRKWLRIVDGDPSSEIGITQAFPLKGGETYEVAVETCCVENASSSGAYVQLRFLPSNAFVQTGLAAPTTAAISEVSLKGTAPADTTRGILYLYTHREPTPSVLVTGVRLTGGVSPPPPPPPAPVPPQYERLQDPLVPISLVREGRPNAVIVAPDDGAHLQAAAAIQQEILRCTGVVVPIVPDDAPEAAVPLTRHLIALGNRSTNQALRALYDRFYCLVDLRFPGPGGYAIRSVHNPFGNGHGALIVGASDDSGLAEGAAKFASLLSSAASGKGELALGWMMETKLGRGVKLPSDIREFETWEASKGYGSIGYFGWCSISKLMAMYWMTGDESSAREFVRLAFPDAKALREIEEIDGERIENKRDPLAGFYHYNAHLAILFWDLIEESPVFSDEERLKITNAFARQLDHRKSEGIYGLTKPPSSVGSRHGQWSAISLYCLGRYFNKKYPGPVWAQCERAGELAFQSLHEHAWVAGESDNLFWYNTGIAPILTYMVLTGDRKPLENGVLGELLRGQEILVSGRVPDWALNSAALDMLHKAAYLTGDGRWIAYRERTGVDTSIFRLGQSFWPEPELEPAPPDDLAGRWSVQRLPEPAWAARRSGLPREQSFYFASFRSAADASGDFILLDGFNGASRNPYHTFDILELRLGGRTILQGYHNQVQTRADGMVEPAVALDAALVHSEVVGATAIAVGEVPQAAFCNWRRTVCQRTGRYALIVDDLTFRTGSRNLTVATTWQVPGGRWDAKESAIRLPPSAQAGQVGYELRACDEQEVNPGPVVTMNWHGAVTSGTRRRAFALIAPASSDPLRSPDCLRLSANAAILALPDVALAVCGEHGQTRGELAVLAGDHLFGHALTGAGLGPVLLSSDVPVEVDWDFATGIVNAVAASPAVLELCLQDSAELRLDGEPVKGSSSGGTRRVPLAAGRHTVTGAVLPAETAAQIGAALEQLRSEAQSRSAAESEPAGSPALPDLPVAFETQVGGKVAASAAIQGAAGPELAVAEGTTIHWLAADGRELRSLQADGAIRVLHWWEGRQLLLAGCVDEKVIAFDRDGRRAWVFTSEMDPAVYEAAKTYWFKSAPGHEGIHGLHTGIFDGGKDRCFVGSACTLEILDGAGHLVNRAPIFWGPCWKFLLTTGGDGSPQLLIAQWPNGGDSLAIVSSRTLAQTGRGFDGVPAGHTFVGGWTAQNRAGLFCGDLDGDGRAEVATAINGTWNRVTVYSESGQPLHNAQFGPGAGSAPGVRMRDMAAADLDGDGRREIVAGLAEGLVVALSATCERVWSTRLPSPPVLLRSLAPPSGKRPWIVAGCEDGRVIVLDGRGAPLYRGKVAGRPARMEVIETPAGPVAILMTEGGEVKGFRVDG